MAGDKNYPQIRREREAREQSERERRGGLHVQARMLQVARDQVRASNRTNILLGVTFTVTFAAVVIAFFAYFSTKDANRKGVTPFAADVQILDDCSWRPIQDDSNDVDGWRQFSREKGLARERSPNAKMCLVPVAINARAK